MRRGGGRVLLAAATFWAVLATQALGSVQDPNRATSYYEYSLARQAWMRQEYFEALGHMRRAIEADPGSANLALDLSRLLLEMNEPQEAADAARRAAGLSPSDPAPARALADALAALATSLEASPGIGQQACDAYRAVLRLAPDDSEAHLSLARLLVSQGRAEEAIPHLKKHAELSPLSDEGLQLAAQTLSGLRRLDEAAELLAAALSRRPPSPQIIVALVEIHESRGDYGAALEAARPLLSIPGIGLDLVRVRLMLARLGQRAGRASEAAESLREAERLMEARPADFSTADRAETRLRLIQSLLDGERNEDGLAMAREGGVRFTGDPRFPLREAEALLLLGRSSEAESVFKRAFPTAPEDPNAAARVSEAYLAAGARKERSGRIDQAEAHLRRSISWNPVNADALNYLGYMLADAGRSLDEAIAFIRRALETEPDNGAFLDSLGWAYFKKGDLDQALQALEKARSLMQDEPAIHDHLGDLYHAMGRSQEAIRSWNEALDHGAENAEAIRSKMGAARQPDARP